MALGQASPHDFRIDCQFGVTAILDLETGFFGLACVAPDLSLDMAVAGETQELDAAVCCRVFHSCVARTGLRQFSLLLLDGALAIVFGDSY